MMIQNIPSDDLWIDVRLKELRRDIDQFFQAAMAAMCRCYDHTKGFYPDSCDCEGRKNVSQATKLLIDEHKAFIKKYNL